jgi:hypothetical protein
MILHLDSSDTLNNEILLKEKIKRLYTAFTSDYTLHIWLPTSTYTLQFLHHYLWPNLSRHWYNLQKSVFACQKYIWKAFKKRIFQYHNIFEYFVKSCQARQALKLLLIGGTFWTFYLAFAALLQCFMHQIHTWTFVRQIKTLVALYKLKPLQNLTWGNILTVLQAMDRRYTPSQISKLFIYYTLPFPHCDDIAEFLLLSSLTHSLTTIQNKQQHIIIEL